MSIELSVECNWNRSSGCDLSELVQTTVTHEDIFIKPQLDEILGQEHAILLTRPDEGGSVQCEMQLHLFPCYKIDSFSFVSSVEKVELFTGPQKEYMETLYGFNMSDEDDNNSEEEAMKTYRYDIEVEKSGVVELAIRMMTSLDEICIYGALLQVAPNPNGITTLLPKSGVNLEHVQKMLNNSSQKISANAEKCKLFMEIYNKIALDNAKSQPNKSAKDPLEFESTLKAHIDIKINALENKINARLDKISVQLHTLEMQQASKMDKILQMLAEK